MNIANGINAMRKIKLLELIFLAKKESDYLNLLITTIGNYLFDPKMLLDDDQYDHICTHLAQIKSFYNKFSPRWYALYSKFTDCNKMDVCSDKNITTQKLILDYIEDNIKGLRTDFTNAHKLFISELDKVFHQYYAGKNQILIYQTLAAAYEFLDSHKKEENETARLKISSYIRIFEMHNKSISNNLPIINAYNTRIIKSPVYDELPQTEWTKAQNIFLQNYFDKHLLLFLGSIKTKFIFFCCEGEIEKYCAEAQQIIQHPELFLPSKTFGFFSQPDANFEIVLNFIKNNVNFFASPYIDNEKFQAWSNTNIVYILPISNILKKSLHSKDQYELFRQALMKYINTNDDKLLARFLLHPANSHLIRDLKMLIEENEYHEIENKKIIFKKLTVSFKDICESWRNQESPSDYFMEHSPDDSLSL